MDADAVNRTLSGSEVIESSSEHSWMSEEGSSGGDYTFCVRCGTYADEPGAKEPCPGNPLPDDEKRRIEAQWRKLRKALNDPSQ